MNVRICSYKACPWLCYFWTFFCYKQTGLFGKTEKWIACNGSWRYYLDGKPLIIYSSEVVDVLFSRHGTWKVKRMQLCNKWLRFRALPVINAINCTQWWERGGGNRKCGEREDEWEIDPHKAAVKRADAIDVQSEQGKIFSKYKTVQHNRKDSN